MIRMIIAIWLLLLATIAAAKDPVTIHLAGDSTMAEKLPEKRPETGWGECLQKYFAPEQVRVKNYAKNGRSTRTFIAEGLWASIMESLKPGDYVFIQFGHNDESKEKVDRYTSPEDYRRNLSRFVEDVRSRNAFPVLLTPVARRRFDPQGQVLDSHGEYPDIVRSVAAQTQVPLIDMEKKSEAVLQHYGAEGSTKLFLQLEPGENPNYPSGVHDNTHFSPAGAAIMAEQAVQGMRELKLPLADLLHPTDAPHP